VKGDSVPVAQEKLLWTDLFHIGQSTVFHEQNTVFIR